MANSNLELNNLDFSSYLGGPLQAAIQAQDNISQSQLRFIEEVGFKNGIPYIITPADLNTVEFEYKKEVPNSNGTGMETKNVIVSVPILTMLTIPSIKVDEVTVDFNMKLASTETINIQEESSKNPSLGLKCAMSVPKKSSLSKKTSEEEKIKTTYGMSVQMQAFNDEIEVTDLLKISDPVSPVLRYVSDPLDNDGELHEVILYWEKTISRGKYYIYKMDLQNNWVKIHEITPNNEIMYLPLSQTDFGLNTLKVLDENGDPQYHYFKVIAENLIGTFSTQENVFTIYNSDTWEDIGGIGVMIVNDTIKKNTFVVR